MNYLIMVQSVYEMELLDRLNSASLKELRKLHTIGEKRASLIFDHRAIKPFTQVSICMFTRRHAHMCTSSCVYAEILIILIVAQSRDAVGRSANHRYE